jgi:hypothetical protein
MPFEGRETQPSDLFGQRSSHRTPSHSVKSLLHMQSGAAIIKWTVRRETCTTAGLHWKVTYLTTGVSCEGSS